MIEIIGVILVVLAFVSAFIVAGIGMIGSKSRQRDGADYEVPMTWPED